MTTHLLKPNWEKVMSSNLIIMDSYDTTRFAVFYIVLESTYRIISNKQKRRKKVVYIYTRTENIIIQREYCAEILNKNYF